MGAVGALTGARLGNGCVGNGCVGNGCLGNRIWALIG